MEPTDPTQRLTSIKTHWTSLFGAPGRGQRGCRRRQQLLLRYYGAVYRTCWAWCATGDGGGTHPGIRGAFPAGRLQAADPERGPVPRFLKTAVRHLAMDYCGRRIRRRPPAAAGGSSPRAGLPSAADDLDGRFLEKWREELLARTWEMLAESQEKTGHPYHLVCG